MTQTSSSHPSSASASASLATAQLFHTDGLHCVFAYLKLAELPVVASVCRVWRDALYCERSRGLHVDRLNSLYLCPLVISPLRHHVSKLSLRHEGVCRLTYRPIVGGLPEMQLMKHLPKLTQLEIGLDGGAIYETAQLMGGGVGATAAISRMFPDGLTSLDMKLHSNAKKLQDILASYQLLVDLVGHQMQLREVTLTKYSGSQGEGPDFSLLQRLPALTKLSLHRFRPSIEAASCLSKFSTLEQLALSAINEDGESLQVWGMPQLEVLTDLTHSRLLQSLRVLDLQHCSLDAEKMRLLARFSMLQELNPWVIQENALPCLALFPCLTTLCLRVSDGYKQMRPFMASLSPHLAACKKLANLTLCGTPLDRASDVESLLAAVPLLHTCDLRECTLTSPSLIALSASTQLRKLILVHSVNMLIDSVPVLANIRSLRVLGISLPAPQRDVALQLLRTPAFHHLTHSYVCASRL
jgi:hypothetical protein